MKLAPRLTLLFALLAIVPILVFSCLAYYAGRRAIETEVSNHLVSTNLLKGNELYRWIDDNKRSLEELAQRPLVAQYSALLAGHNSSTAEYAAARESLVAEHLLPRVSSGRGFTELFIICPRHGIILASSDALQEGKYRDEEPFYTQGKTGTYVYGVYFSPSREQLALTIGTPVRDRQGNLAGVLAGQLNLGDLSAIISAQSGLSLSEDTYLVNASNFFITEPRFGTGYALRKTVRSEGVNKGLSGRDGVAYYSDYRDVPVIGAYKWLPEYSIVLITEVNQAEAYAPIYNVGWTIMALLLVLIVIVIATGFLVARSVTLPVRRLVEGTEEIGSGNLDYRVGTKTADEIGGLSRAIDRMADELKATTVSRNELIESEEKYRLIIENSRDMIFTLDNAGIFMFMSPAFERMLGYKPADMTGRPIGSLIHPDDARMVGDSLKLFIEKGEFAAGLEYRVKHASGEWRWHATSGNRVLNNRGELLSFVGIAHDITERKKVTDELRLLSERQEAILAAVPNIIMEVDENKVYTWANQAAIEFFGEDAIGREAAYYFVGEQDTYNAVEPLFSGDEHTFYVESWQRRKDGESRLLAWSCRVLKDGSGRIRGALSSAQDITERKRVEEAIRELNERLEERVLERTAQLEAANRELEAFSYSVSHDLRAPLRAIDGYTQILQEDHMPGLDAEGRRVCSVISQSARNMGTLIDDLLSFSRMGRSEMQLSRIDMATMANSIYYELTTPEQRGHIDFSVGPVPAAEADPALMRQVWSNLISNAIKFSSRQPRAVITIGGSEGNKENFYSVQDNGAGFDMQYIDKLFGVFQRLHSAGEFDGNGVGLAIVQRVVRRHGGRVWALGEVNRGAIFSFTLPGHKEAV